MAENSCERHGAVWWTELTGRMDGHWREQRYPKHQARGREIILNRNRKSPKRALEGKMITIVLDSDLMKPICQHTDG